MVRVLFFGITRDLAGTAEATVDVEPGMTLGDLLGRYPQLAPVSKNLVLALNAEFAARTTPLKDGDEVAFLPPVSGGADAWVRVKEDEAGHFFALTRKPIVTRDLVRRLQRPEDGAVAVFEGVVRNESGGRQTLFLEYEGYEPMALKVMAQIGKEIAAKHAIGRIGMIHRLGRLEIGEASVLIVATAPHRKPAFEACREGIDRLKKLAPIWKKEHFADGAVWVEGEWDSSVQSS